MSFVAKLLSMHMRVYYYSPAVTHLTTTNESITRLRCFENICPQRMSTCMILLPSPPSPFMNTYTKYHDRIGQL